MDIEIGWKVEDVITGFSGVVTGLCTYITGCDQALVQPKGSDQNKKEDCHWIDVNRLERVGDSILVLDKIKNTGSDMAPPTR